MINLANSIGAALKRRIGKARLDWAAQPILATPPIVPDDHPVVIFSMIGSHDVLAYLVAVKSLHHQLGMGRIALLNDGSLTPSDIALLNHHCGNPDIYDLRTVDTGTAPKGGAWERLMTLLELRRSAYVIQLDSDTVTLGPVPEIKAAIAESRSFTLRGGPDSALHSLPEASAYAHARKPAGRPHVQWCIEAALYKAVTDLPDARYVRGCAGFAGFAPSDEGRQFALTFSKEAERLVGARWHEWGSEQVTSNFLIANTAKPLLLPYDRYCNFWLQSLDRDTALVHFVGTHRYDAGCYIHSVKHAITMLQTR